MPLSRNVNSFTGASSAWRLKGTLEGGPALAAALRRLDDQVRVQASKDAVEAAAKPIERAWIRKLPVGPGPIHMKDAIKTRVTKTKRGANGTVQVKNRRGGDPDKQPTAYARTLEFGSRTRPARPAARPAFDENKERALSNAERVLRHAARSAGR
jgi:HK97 gp10 family phage protein